MTEFISDWLGKAKIQDIPLILFELRKLNVYSVLQLVHMASVHESIKKHMTPISANRFEKAIKQLMVGKMVLTDLDIGALESAGCSKQIPVSVNLTTQQTCDVPDPNISQTWEQRASVYELRNQVELESSNIESINEVLMGGETGHTEPPLTSGAREKLNLSKQAHQTRAIHLIELIKERESQIFDEHSMTVHHDTRIASKATKKSPRAKGSLSHVTFQLEEPEQIKANTNTQSALQKQRVQEHLRLAALTPGNTSSGEASPPFSSTHWECIQCKSKNDYELWKCPACNTYRSTYRSTYRHYSPPIQWPAVHNTFYLNRHSTEATDIIKMKSGSFKQGQCNKSQKTGHAYHAPPSGLHNPMAHKLTEKRSAQPHELEKVKTSTQQKQTSTNSEKTRPLTDSKATSTPVSAPPVVTTQPPSSPLVFSAYGRNQQLSSANYNIITHEPCRDYSAHKQWELQEEKRVAEAQLTSPAVLQCSSTFIPLSDNSSPSARTRHRLDFSFERDYVGNRSYQNREW